MGNRALIGGAIRLLIILHSHSTQFLLIEFIPPAFSIITSMSSGGRQDGSEAVTTLQSGTIGNRRWKICHAHDQKTETHPMSFFQQTLLTCSYIHKYVYINIQLYIYIYIYMITNLMSNARIVGFRMVFI